MKRILVFFEADTDGFRRVSYELLKKALELSERGGYRVCTVSIGGKLSENPLYGFGIAEHYHIERCADFDIAEYAKVLARLCRECKPEIFLMGATKLGRALAPYTAGLLEIGLTADCTALELDDSGRLVQIRPAYGETLTAKILSRTMPQFATVRPGTFALPSKKKNGLPQIFVRKSAAPDSSPLYDLLPDVKDGVDIRTAEKLVVLGGGMMSRENIEPFRKWAESMGAELCSSRVLVERGWFPQSRQIGLSGSCVHAKLMITIGVSGSIQFRAGIQNVGRLIAINTDPEAPIFGEADTAIVCDLNEILG